MKGKLVKNIVKKPFRFILTFEDGRTEKMEIEAESFSAAVLSLPRFSAVGTYKYQLVSRWTE